MSETINVRLKKQSGEYQIIVGGSIGDAGEWTRKILSAKRVMIVSNKKVFGIYGERVVGSLKKNGFQTFVHLIGDGERFKSFSTLEKSLSEFSKAGLSRTDAVIALGGGVVGDLAGFAASIYLRGIAFLQVPTTLLSMIDSSVGGKTAVNTSFGKNLIGTFYQPSGVLIDPTTLRTLSKREVTAGLCEAVKQGAVGGKGLFDQTRRFLENGSLEQELPGLVAAQIKFKAKIVAGDEHESAERTDAASRKILNFGHTFAHALEKAKEYKYIKHGEAVGWGIIFVADLSKKLELLPEDKVKLLNDVVHRTGKLPSIGNIDPAAIFDRFKFDKKVVNNSLQWVLLEDIGKPVITSDENIPRKVIKQTVDEIIAKS
jgi:3-dehydroquinate synthase